MKKVQILVLTALLSLNLINLGVSQEYKFGFGSNFSETGSIEIDLAEISFSEFSQAVHDAIHSKYPNLYNDYSGQVIQILAVDKQTVLDENNFTLALETTTSLLYRCALGRCTQEVFPAPYFYVQKITKTEDTAEQVVSTSASA